MCRKSSFFIYVWLLIKIKTENQHKIAFICPWGTFMYKKILFGVKNVGENFQWVMNFLFHDIKHIVEPYLDDLLTHSWKRNDHLDHLLLHFERCENYKIHLDPHNCIFCVKSRRLLVFILSKNHIGLIHQK